MHIGQYQRGAYRSIPSWCMLVNTLQFCCTRQHSSCCHVNIKFQALITLKHNGNCSKCNLYMPFLLHGDTVTLYACFFADEIWSIKTMHGCSAQMCSLAYNGIHTGSHWFDESLGMLECHVVFHNLSATTLCISIIYWIVKVKPKVDAVFSKPIQSYIDGKNVFDTFIVLGNVSLLDR